MLTKEDDVEINALAARGWSVSAISRHTGRDRKTVRRYLAAPRPVRVSAPGCLEPYRAYIAARFEDDRHLEATVLHRELVEAGFGRAYTTLVGELRRLGLRPVCLVCAQRRGDQVTTEIAHPAGEEIQWDWLELAAADVPWGEATYVLVGALSHSGRFRGVLCEAMTFGHLAAGMHQVLVALGGTPRVWRTDRMATVVSPQTGRITPHAAALAKHYGAQIAVCPPRRAQRKGVVENASSPATPSSSTACSRPRSMRPSSAASKAACASPSCPPARPCSSSIATPNRPWTHE
jgi:transposase